MHGSVAHAEPEVEPASADLVDVRRGRRHRARVTEVDRLDRRTEADRRGDVRERGAQAERISEARAVDPGEAAAFDLDRHLQRAGTLSRDGGEGDGGHRHGIGPPVRWIVGQHDCRPARSVAPCPGAHPRRGRVRAPHVAARRLRELGRRQLDRDIDRGGDIGGCRDVDDRGRAHRADDAGHHDDECRSAQPGCRVLRARTRSRSAWPSSRTDRCRSRSSIRASTAPRRASRRRPMTCEPGCRPPRRPRSGRCATVDMHAYAGLDARRSGRRSLSPGPVQPRPRRLPAAVDVPDDPPCVVGLRGRGGRASVSQPDRGVR